jgi:hypothetical protein
MSTKINTHWVTELRVDPPQRLNSSWGEQGYVYTQDVVAKTEDGNDVCFQVFFTEAVSKRLENERIEEQRIEEMEMRAVIEQSQHSYDMAGLMGRFSVKR